MESDLKVVESYKKMITTAASIAASAMLVRSVVNDVVPYEVRDFVTGRLTGMFSRWTSQHTIVIEETEGYSSNLVYDSVKAYLATRISTDMPRLRASLVDEAKSLIITMESGQVMVDVYDNTEFKWRLVSHQNSGGGFGGGNNGASGGGGAFGGSSVSRYTEVKSFELTFDKKHKEKALNGYLPFIMARSKAIKLQDQTLKIYMNDGDTWSPIDLHHPSTFDTLAMDPELKTAVLEDLARFVKRKEYYKKIGKAWKRGYLLYGPPGTGKSSLVAAMANYLKFDIYDLELTEVNWNSWLRRLIIGMSNKSILVIEDIDCSVDFQREEDRSSTREGKVTLSGVLNFVDGLLSMSGEERIIVFTTNYKERLDPALLRPGRMDMHIHMGYCSPSSFRILASNYHSVNYHPLFPAIEGLIGEVEVTPAEVAEELMRNDDTDKALESLLSLLNKKKDDKSKSTVAVLSGEVAVDGEVTDEKEEGEKAEAATEIEVPLAEAEGRQQFR